MVVMTRTETAAVDVSRRAFPFARAAAKEAGPMAEFVAFKAQNMNDLTFDEPGSYFSFGHSSSDHEVNEFKVKSNDSNVVIVFKGIFAFQHVSGGYSLTGGTIEYFMVEVNGHNSYAFTDFEVPLMKFLKHSTPGQLSATQFGLIMNYNSQSYPDVNYIVSSSGNDVLRGGAPRNEYVFEKKPFGHDTIAYFNTHADIIAFDHTIYGNPFQIHSHIHLNSHNDVVIKVDAADTITLDNVHHISDLTIGDFLII
jgi:hypothetical protein